MGCGCFTARPHNMNSTFNKTRIIKTGECRDLLDTKVLKDETIKVNVTKHENTVKKFLYAISPQNWLKILDYLTYKDLKESGKANR